MAEIVTTYGPVRPGGVWVSLCLKKAERPFQTDATVCDEAERAAWHVNNSTKLTSRVRKIDDALYSVDAQLTEPYIVTEEVGGHK